MVLLSQTELLGNIIPTVFINQITLETKNQPDVVSTNPHIDTTLIPEFIQDPITGKGVVASNFSFDVKKKSFIKPKPSGLKDPGFINQSLQETSAEQLSITLDLVMKEKMDNGLVGTWFKNENFSKYLKLKIFQVTNKSLSQEATKNKILLNFYDTKKTFNFSDELKNDANSFIKKILNIRDNSIDVRSLLNTNIQVKELSVKDDIYGGSDVNNKYTEVDDNGNTITSFPYRVRFELNNTNPEHLSYFAFSYIDVQQLAKDYHFHLTKNLNQEPIGKVVSEIVVDDFDIIDQSFVYTDQDGIIWTGNISINDKDEVFGISNNGSLILLNKVIVGNAKLQDFRHFKQLERLTDNFSNIDNTLFILKNSINNDVNVKVPNNFFSKIYLSRDHLGQCRFYFSMNILKLIQDNSKFSFLLKNKNIVNEIIKKSFILSMKIYRRRVGGSPEIGSAPILNVLFDTNQFDDTIAISGEKDYKTLIPTNNTTGSVKEITNLFVSDQNNINEQQWIRNFTGIDKTMPQITDGYYIYGVQTEIHDPTSDFLLEKVDDLEDGRNKLNAYLQEALQPTIKTSVIINNNPHIELPNTEKVGSGEIFLGNFDPFLNRFTQEFIETQKNKYRLGFIDNVSTPWGEGVEKYINVLKIMTNISDSDLNKMKQYLLFFVHPATGNIEGVSKLIKLIETLEKTINNALGIDPTIVSGFQNVSSDTTSKLGFYATNILPILKVAHKQKRSINSFTIDNIFQNTSFNSNISISTGYDFFDLDIETDTNDGMRVISGQEYADRVDKEKSKYFNRPNGLDPDININVKSQPFTTNDHIDNTSYSFLTPAKIKISNIELNRIGHSPTPSISPEQFTHLDLTIKTNNTTTTPKKNKDINRNININETSQAITNDLLGFFTNIGLEPILEHNIIKTPLTDVLKVKHTSRPSVIIDPVGDENGQCNNNISTQNIDVVTKTNHINPNPLLLTLANHLSSVKMFPNSEQSLRKVSKNNKNKGKNKNTLNTFDISDPNSLIQKVIQQKDLHSSALFLYDNKTKDPTLNDALKGLPNQIKSLLLSKVSTNIVRKNWFDEEKDPLLSIDNNTEFRLDYQMINMVQVFDGYEVSKNNDLQLKKTKWIPLTLELYNKSVGNALLCRLKHYENNLLGIEKDEIFDLPVYNEFFLLEPKRKAEQNTQILGKASDFHKQNTLQFAIRKEYMTNNIVNNIRK